MHSVRVKFDLIDSPRTLRLDGQADDYPVVGKDWGFSIKHDGRLIHIDLGRILNLKNFEGMLLVQTDLTVAEIWILESSGSTDQLFDPRPGFDRGKLSSKMGLLKDEVAIQRRNSFRLIKRGLND